MSEQPTDDELRNKIYDLVKQVNLETMGMKSFIQLLSNEFGVELKARKPFIKMALMEAINDNNNNQEEDEEEESEEEEEEEESEEEEEEEESSEEEEEVVTAKKKKSNKATSGRTGGGGLSQKKRISNELAIFLGCNDNMMARTDVVKELWNYIRKNNLQNPNNKREIFLDTPMKKVFNCNTFTMFTMNKYVSAHMEPFKPVDLTTSTTTTSTTNNKPTKRKATGGGKGSGTAVKKRGGGNQPPFKLSNELSDIVGTNILPRPQVVSKLWIYIKGNNLQDPNDKRFIICDDKLKKIMGNKSKISMFQMNTYISEHLLEKVDKSQYVHEVAAAVPNSEDDEEEDSESE